VTTKVEGGGSLDVFVPKDPASGSGAGGLTPVPFLVKVDRYGSVSGLSRVETPLGYLVISLSNEAGSFDSP